MKLGTQVGLAQATLGPSSPQKGSQSHKFSTRVCCGQRAGWIKMPRGTEIGLGPCHIVLDGDPAPPKGAHQPSLFGPCVFWPNGWMDKDATWYGDIGPGPGHIVLDGDQPPKGLSPQSSAYVCCGQTAGWIKMPLGTAVGFGSGDIVLYGVPVTRPPQKEGGGRNSPQFSVHVYCGQTAGWIQMALDMEVGLGQATLC